MWKMTDFGLEWGKGLHTLTQLSLGVLPSPLSPPITTLEPVD